MSAIKGLDLALYNYRAELTKLPLKGLKVSFTDYDIHGVHYIHGIVEDVQVKGASEAGDIFEPEVWFTVDGREVRALSCTVHEPT